VTQTYDDYSAERRARLSPEGKVAVAVFSRTRAVATALHEAWRAPRATGNGTFEPRVKDDGAGGTVDIANTTYEALPSKWQAENLASATAAIVAVEALARGDNVDTELVSAAVHVAWLERNGDWAEPEQAVPYAQLSEMEKDKDRSVAAAAAAALGVQLT